MDHRRLEAKRALMANGEGARIAFLPSSRGRGRGKKLPIKLLGALIAILLFIGPLGCSATDNAGPSPVLPSYPGDSCIPRSAPQWENMPFDRPSWCLEGWRCYPDDVAGNLFLFIRAMIEWAEDVERLCKPPE